MIKQEYLEVRSLMLSRTDHKYESEWFGGRYTQVTTRGDVSSSTETILIKDLR